MKLLVLNPHFNAQHQVVLSLQKKGWAVLLASDVTEALQTLQLHGATIELLIAHREDAEGKGTGGAELLTKARALPGQEDLPTILTSSVWGNAEFATHQKTPEGANAYLRYPFDAAALETLLAAVIGTVPSAPPAKSGRTSADLILEDASGLFSKPETSPRKSTITLELPALPGLTGSVSGSVLETSRANMPAPELSEPPALPEIEHTGEAPSSLPAAPIEAAEGVQKLPEVSATDHSSSSSEGGIAISMDAGSAELELSPGRAAPAADSPVSPLPPTPVAHPGEGQEIDFSGSLGADEATVAVGSGDLSQFMSDHAPASDSPAVPFSLAPDGADAGIGAAFTPSQEAYAPASPAESESLPTYSESEVETTREKAQLEKDLPYLFGGTAKDRTSISAYAFTHPVDDAVVPGGALNAPDLETLKKYLLLREQDVSALSSQLKTSKEQNHSLEDELHRERVDRRELEEKIQAQQKLIDHADQDKQFALQAAASEIEELKFQLKVKTDKARVLELQVKDASNEVDRIKERVKQDIRKIRVREKELENRLEILKKDSEALLSGRESKIIELKRKIDLLEFNMDLLQDQYQKEKGQTQTMREKLGRAAQAIRLAGGLLDTPTHQLIASLGGDAAESGAQSDPEELKEAS